MDAQLIDIRVSDPASAEAKRCLEIYFAELAERYGGFDPAISRPLPAEQMMPPAGLLLLAYHGEQAVGCGALSFYRDDAAAIKRVWVAPAVRGRGLGRRLLTELENQARARGIRLLQLETKDELHEALGMYRSAGYQEVAPFNDEFYADRWFEKHLTEE